MKVTPLLNRARVLLNDAAGTRATDAILLPFVMEFLADAKDQYPEEFIGTLATAITDITTPDTQDFPMRSVFEQRCVDYVVGRVRSIASERQDPKKAVNHLKASVRT